MFGLDRGKVRVVAILMTGAAAIQFWPNAYATEHEVAIVRDTDSKLKDSKKKKDAGTASPTNPWTVTKELASTTASLNEPVEPPKPSKSDRIKLVIETAHELLGRPYRWAAAGPNAFDCSGFTQYVWKKAGVALPHNSGAQRASTKHVDLGKMKPGDLIFSSGHVGLYIGKGKMIHSPRTGKTVSISPIHSRAYGAGRPLP